VAGTNVRAEVITQFGRISDSQVALPVEDYADPGNVVPVPIENGSVVNVIAKRDITQLANHRDVVFLDVGRADGVALGDIYEVIATDNRNDSDFNAVPKEVARLQIVHVRENSASGLLINISNIGTRPGAHARLVRKMPS
jgi:hypothetical protein